jgi:hypothetical protein
MRARNNNDGINIQEQFGSATSATTTLRPEMKGPSDISELLSGLKTMSVNMPVGANATVSSTTNVSSAPPIPIKKSASTGKTPRKQKSDKNTVSLDI